MNDRQHAGLLPQQNTLAGLKRPLLFFYPASFWVSGKISASVSGSLELAPSPGKPHQPGWKCCHIPFAITPRSQSDHFSQQLTAGMKPCVHLHIHKYIPIS